MAGMKENEAEGVLEILGNLHLDVLFIKTLLAILGLVC